MSRMRYTISPLEPAALLLRQRFDLASMDDLDIGVVFINAAIAQIDNDLLWRLARASSRIVGV